MRASLLVTILAVGAIGFVPILWSTAVYRYQIAGERQIALEQRLRHAWHDLRADAEASAHERAARLLAAPGWEGAWQRGDARELARRLDAVTVPGRKAARNPGESFRLVRAKQAPPADAPCAGADENMSERTNGAGICVNGERISYVYRLALPDTAPGGALEVAIDLRQRLRRLEAILRGPLRLQQADARVLFATPGWTAAHAEEDAVRASLPLAHVLPARAPLLLTAADYDPGRDSALMHLHYLIVLASLALLLVVSAVALWMLERSALTPMRALSARLREIRSDKRALGDPVRVAGNSEVVELARGFNDMTGQLRELYQSLEEMAFTDALTGLPNRALFHDRLQHQVLVARRDQKPFALFIMDLDRFKDINDTLGHHVGDEVLKHVAVRLRAKLRESDTVARMGGDEFAVLLPTADMKHAGMAARMLLQTLRVPIELGEQRLDIGASIGIALFPEHGLDTAALIQRADVAMYAAKGNGSGFVFYNDRLDQHSARQLTLLSELRRAVQEEQFELHFHPKLDLRSGAVTGAEALLRWRHPSGELIPPENFIELLEHTGLIKSLTPWLLSEAMAMIQRLASHSQPLAISVNVSVRDLQDPGFSDTLAEQLAAHQVDPARLELEITESSLMTEPERTISILTTLTGMGVKIAIDDFGTGYSSFAYLKKMPVRTLKIDRSFVTGMLHDDSDAAIVRTSIELAHNLNLYIVAEGVEDAETLERLRALGCDAAQGMFLSTPLPADEFVDWVARTPSA